MILSVSKNMTDYMKVNSSSFRELNIWERQNIQEWIRENPEILGEELLVVSIEFDRFVQSNDRLDILAIDRLGNLVVIEIKRDTCAAYADLQSIRYAAMVSTMTIEKLLPYYLKYQKKYLATENPSEEIARTNIIEFVSDDDFQELSNKPRIILCSEDFSPEITTTVLWLNANGLDVTCVRIKPYQIGNQYIVVPSRIIPLEEAQQYLIDIQVKENKEIERKDSRPRTIRLIVDNKLLQDNEIIYLKNDLPEHMDYDEKDPTYRASITGKTGRSNSILWEKDGKEYSISALTWKIFKETHPERRDPGGVNGNWHWVDERGRALWSIAQEFWVKQ